MGQPAKKSKHRLTLTVKKETIPQIKEWLENNVPRYDYYFPAVVEHLIYDRYRCVTNYVVSLRLRRLSDVVAFKLRFGL